MTNSQRKAILVMGILLAPVLFVAGSDANTILVAFGGPLASIGIGDSLPRSNAGSQPVGDQDSHPFGELATKPQLSYAARSVHKSLAASEEEGRRLRGAAEIKLYAMTAPSVVLVLRADGGGGSGTMIGDKGEILTNWHVIRDQTEVAVLYKPRSELAEITGADFRKGRIEKFDEVSDLALIRVEYAPTGRLVLRLAPMDAIAVGADVHAIGHPTGESWTYTRGVISQIRRKYEWTGDGRVQHIADVIQTQTPINPGNSGGPLLDDKGRIVGINSFKPTGTEGLNFAVATTEIKRFLESPTSRTASRNPECEPKVVRQERSTEPPGTFYFLDLDCDGIGDALGAEPDDTREPITIMFDTNSDGEIDVILFDRNRDGSIDSSIWDSDYDGEPDLRGYHPNGGWEPDRVERYQG